MHRALIFVAAMLAAAFLAPAAHASTVTVETTNQEGDIALAYAAEPGESNDLTIATNGAREYVGWFVSDNTAPLTAGEGCRQVDEHTASCPFGNTDLNIAVDADLGDGNDNASVALACGFVEDETNSPCQHVIVHGGEGNDVIWGSDVASEIFGDSGDDFLQAGENGGTLDGGDGNDRLTGAGGADRLLGRAGADRIDGHAGNDVIRGHAGDDDLHGGYGVDELNGNGGNDRIVGGVDNDTIWAGDGRRDRVDGSFGTDRANVDRRDVVNSVERRV